MSDIDHPLMKQAQSWLAPLAGDTGPCGPDLEYDNAFLELGKAAEGKPETQFDKGAPPDWRQVREMAEELMGRTRDLRVALLWLRATACTQGLVGFAAGLHLVLGMLQTMRETLHPLPDPDDGDPYARANALAMLPLLEGGLGDLHGAVLARVKGVGEVRVREVEVACSVLTARAGEATYSRDQLTRMFEDAEREGAGLHALAQGVQETLRTLAKLMDEHFGAGTGASLKPLLDVIGRTLSLLPVPATQAAPEADGAAGDPAAGAAPGAAAPAARPTGLSGSVTTRAEALRAIELVCAYLEKHEPTNPAQLFLRRASRLLERNFLELLKELAPNAVDEVARMVGIDPKELDAGN